MSISRSTPGFLVALATALVVSLLALLLTVGGTAQAQEAPGAGIASPTLLPGQSGLRVNEFMASNQTAVPDPDDSNQYPDWVEIYNPGAQAVSLDGLALTDREIEPGRAPIPAGITIGPGGFFVFYLDGDLSEGPEHLNLGLSGDGEFIGLYEVASGTRIDGYTFGPQTADVSEGRKPDGSGAFQPIPGGTPNESNQKNAPVISNVARSIEQPQAGQAVEVSAVITDNASVVAASLVYTADAASGVTVNLSQSGNTWKATIPGFGNGVFVQYVLRARDNDGNLVQTRWAGYVVGYVAPVLKINEFVAENFGAVPDRDDPTLEYPDWMELYNPGSAAVSLNGLYLTDNPREPDRYAIPNGFTIPAKGVLLIYLDDDEDQGPAIHTNFNLDKKGEFLGLYGARGTVAIDTISFGQQFDNVALGRFPDGEGDFITLVCTTPGKKNMLCEQKNYLPSVGGQ